MPIARTKKSLQAAGWFVDYRKGPIESIFRAEEKSEIRAAIGRLGNLQQALKLPSGTSFAAIVEIAKQSLRLETRTLKSVRLDSNRQLAERHGQDDKRRRQLATRIRKKFRRVSISGTMANDRKRKRLEEIQAEFRAASRQHDGNNHLGFFFLRRMSSMKGPAHRPKFASPQTYFIATLGQYLRSLIGAPRPDKVARIAASVFDIPNDAKHLLRTKQILRRDRPARSTSRR